MAAKSLGQETLVLEQGASRCEIRPQIGGSIASWTVQGQSLLRTASASSIAAADPFGMATFPLVPYSNRIGNAAFIWDQKAIRLTRNFPPELHSIHGVGFNAPGACSTAARIRRCFSSCTNPMPVGRLRSKPGSELG